MSTTAQLRIPRSADPVPTAPRLRSVRIPLWVYVGSLLAIVGVLVLGAQAAGWFVTSGRTAAGTGERVVPNVGSSTADIKGWMSVQQVLDAYPVTVEALYAQFAVPAGTATSTTLSELKAIDGVTLDVPALRAWIDAVAGTTAS
jgi:hypothetical protein